MARIYIVWHPRPCRLTVFLSSNICRSEHLCSWVQSLKWNVVISWRWKKHKWNKTPISLHTCADVLDMNWSFHPPWHAASGPFVLCGMQRSKQTLLMSSFLTIFWSCLFLVYLLNSLWLYFAFLSLETCFSSQATDIAGKVTALNWKPKHNLWCLSSHSHTDTKLKPSITHWPFLDLVKHFSYREKTEDVLKYLY